MDTAEAIATHAEIRQNLENFAKTSKATLQMYAVSGDTCCKLGEWLQDQRKQGKYLNLHQVHREFHDRAGRIMRLISSKQFTAAERMMADEFHIAETELLSMLRELQ